MKGLYTINWFIIINIMKSHVRGKTLIFFNPSHIEQGRDFQNACPKMAINRVS